MRSKKGFTLVELLIVIAILAILATVAIVGYTSFIDKANQSVDEQAVTQINKALEAFEITDEKPGDLTQLIRKLEDMDLDLGDYKPLKSGMQFYWVKSENRIIYVDDAKNVAYPEKYVDLSYIPGDWFVLDGTIARESIDYSKIENGTLHIATAGQFAQLADDYANGRANSVTNIVLENDIYLDGAQVTFGKITSNLEIDGQGHKIYGARVSSNTAVGSGDYADKKYGYGLFGTIEKDVTVIIRNVNFVGMNVGDATSANQGQLGLIAGCVDGTLTISQVTFTDCTVVGLQKVGALVGTVRKVSTNVPGEVHASQIKFENTMVIGYADTAKLIGYIYNDTTVSWDSSDVSGITVKPFEEGMNNNEESLNNNKRTWDNIEVNGNKYNVWIRHEKDPVTLEVVALCTDALAWKQLSDDNKISFEWDKWDKANGEIFVTVIPVNTFNE